MSAHVWTGKINPQTTTMSWSCANCGGQAGADPSAATGWSPFFLPPGSKTPVAISADCDQAKAQILAAQPTPPAAVTPPSTTAHPVAPVPFPTPSPAPTGPVAPAPSPTPAPTGASPAPTGPSAPVMARKSRKQQQS